MSPKLFSDLSASTIQVVLNQVLGFSVFLLMSLYLLLGFQPRTQLAHITLRLLWWTTTCPSFWLLRLILACNVLLSSLRTKVWPMMSLCGFIISLMSLEAWAKTITGTEQPWRRRFVWDARRPVFSDRSSGWSEQYSRQNTQRYYSPFTANPTAHNFAVHPSHQH